MKKYTPQAISISSPSGTGKSTVIKGLMSVIPKLELSVSTTTREPRPGEVHGCDYRFVKNYNFWWKIIIFRFLEWERVYGGTFYGTPRAEYKRIVSCQKVPVFDVDVKGALRMKEKLGDKLLTIFLQAPLPEIEKRLRLRGTETECKIKERLARAEMELGLMNQFDRIVCNAANDQGALAIWQGSIVIKRNFPILEAA